MHPQRGSALPLRRLGRFAGFTGGSGCLVDLEGDQEVGTKGRSAMVAHLKGDCPIKKRTRPGPLDDQITIYELLQRSVDVLGFQGALPRSVQVPCERLCPDSGKHCFTLLICPIHQGLIPQGVHLSKRCDRAAGGSGRVVP